MQNYGQGELALHPAALSVEPASGIGRSHGTSNSAAFDRWFRYPAGFASDYVRLLLSKLDLHRGDLVIDPFAGTAVTGTSARLLGVNFFGVEAHPAVAELGQLKVAQTPTDPHLLTQAAIRLADKAQRKSRLDTRVANESEPHLVTQSFSSSVLLQLVLLRDMIIAGEAGLWATHLKWALLGTLRDVAEVRVGWPYQYPGQSRKPRYGDPLARFVARAAHMAEDLKSVDSTVPYQGTVVHGDSSNPTAWLSLSETLADGSVSSPPYLNNFDYADATRLEMYFWGEVGSWSELVSKIRPLMVTATTQQSSVPAAAEAAARLDHVIPDSADQIRQIMQSLEHERRLRKRGKEYDRVVPVYFLSIAQVLAQMSCHMRSGAQSAWLVGDSAPYGVYIDTPAILLRIAEQFGFLIDDDQLLRQRGRRWTKGRNRHDVQLTERLIRFRRE